LWELLDALTGLSTSWNGFNTAVLAILLHAGSHSHNRLQKAVALYMEAMNAGALLDVFAHFGICIDRKSLNKDYLHLASPYYRELARNMFGEFTSSGMSQQADISNDG
jgi:hypothetical protein